MAVLLCWVPGSMSLPTHAECVVVGAGVAGAAAAMHLAAHGADVLVLEAGEVGCGIMGARELPAHASTRDGDEREVHYSATSGSAVLPAPVSCVKMAIRLYACSTKEYVRQHGAAGARAYLRAAAKGIEYIKRLGPAVLPSPETQLRALGSLYVADQDGAEGLEEEYRLLRALGVDDIELWDQAQVEAQHGRAAGFVRGAFCLSIYMHVYVCVCRCIGMFICACMSVCIHVFMYISVFLSLSLSLSLSTCIHTHTYIHTRFCTGDFLPERRHPGFERVCPRPAAARSRHGRRL